MIRIRSFSAAVFSLSLGLFATVCAAKTEASTCELPPTGFFIDENGCLVSQRSNIDNDFFVGKTTKLSPIGLEVLRQLRAPLRAATKLRIGINVHTDAVGSTEDNLALSNKQCKTLRNSLISLGIAGSRIQCQGLGESESIGDNGTEAGRKLNRRIELILE